MTILIAVAGGLLLLAGVATAGVWYFSRAPGSNHSGPLPALTDDQKTLSAKLRADVEMLATTIGPRDCVTHQAELRKAADYVVAEWTRAGFTPKRLPFEVRSVAVENLEVIIPGTEHPEQVLVVGAHYDTVDTTPGADDNASGVAGLLAVSRRLKANPPKTTVKLVAFVNEEPPFFKSEKMGSLVYARQLKAQGDAVYAMVSLEMLGVYDDAPGSQKYPPLVSSFYPDQANFIAFVGDHDSRALVHESISAFRSVSKFPSQAIAAPSIVTGIDFSDHWSFRQTGVPAIMITDTSFFRYDHYHEPTDTPDRLDYDRMARVVDGVARALHQIADAH